MASAPAASAHEPPEQRVQPETQVNPNDLRGITDPPNNYSTNTERMIILSDNPYLAYLVAEPTPNLLSHELHHALTGYVHGEPDPCYTPAVGKPDDQCPRGFNMALSGSLDAASQYNRAVASVYTS